MLSPEVETASHYYVMHRFRTVLFWMHLTAGSGAGIVVLVMCVTGVALTYEKQMLEWADMSVLVGAALGGCLAAAARDAAGQGASGSAGGGTHRSVDARRRTGSGDAHPRRKPEPSHRPLRGHRDRTATSGPANVLSRRRPAGIATSPSTGRVSTGSRMFNRRCQPRVLLHRFERDVFVDSKDASPGCM